MPPRPFLNQIELLREDVPSFDWYPFALDAVRNLETVALHPKVTYFVGENGCGKATFLEALAVAWKFNPEGGSRSFGFDTPKSHSKLSVARVEFGHTGRHSPGARRRRRLRKRPTCPAIETGPTAGGHRARQASALPDSIEKRPSPRPQLRSARSFPRGPTTTSLSHSSKPWDLPPPGRMATSPTCGSAAPTSCCITSTYPSARRTRW